MVGIWTIVGIAVDNSLVVNGCGKPLWRGSKVHVLLHEVVIWGSLRFIGLYVGAFIQSNPLLRFFAGLSFPLDILTIVLGGSVKDWWGLSAQPDSHNALHRVDDETVSMPHFEHNWFADPVDVPEEPLFSI